MSFLGNYILRRPHLLFWLQAVRDWKQGKPFDHGGLKNAAYDSQLNKVMKRVLKPDSVCVDGGANKGMVLQQMSEIAPRASHYAFEPIPDLYERLRQQFPHHHVRPQALGDSPGTANFKHVTNAPAYSGLRERNYYGMPAAVREIPVEVDTLDRIIPAGTPISFIKLDLEGGEYHALRGGAELIRQQKPVIAFEAGEGSTACYGVTPEMLFSLITDGLGLQLSTMARWLAGSPGFRLQDFLEAYETDFFFLAYP